MSERDRRITPSQAEQAANFVALLQDVEEFLEALQAHGLIINVSRQAGVDLLTAKGNLDAWFVPDDNGEGEEEDDDER